MTTDIFFKSTKKKVIIENNCFLLLMSKTPNKENVYEFMSLENNQNNKGG